MTAVLLAPVSTIAARRPRASFGKFLTGAGLGFGAGVLLNSIIGGNSAGGTIGSGIGGLGGAALGAALIPVLGPAGPLVGGRYRATRRLDPVIHEYREMSHPNWLRPQTTAASTKASIARCSSDTALATWVPCPAAGALCARNRDAVRVVYSIRCNIGSFQTTSP